MTRRTILPKWIRDKGIASQRELVLALIPYLDWITNQDLKLQFEIILPHTENMDGSNDNLSSYLVQLRKAGHIETRYDSTYINPKSGMTVRRTSHRRLVKSVPKTHIAKKMLDGTYAIPKIKIKKKRKPAKTNVRKLTHDDVRYIQCNNLDMSGPQLAEMFNITIMMTYKIMKGHIPRHLRS